MADLEENCKMEMEAMESVYEKEAKFWQDQDVWKGRFKASPKLPEHFQICVQKTDMAAKEGRSGKLYTVTYLPPLELDIVFPCCYPSKKPPFYKISCPWLTRLQMTKLCQRMDKLWMENVGEEILYPWFHFLDQELLEYLNIQSPLAMVEEESPQNIGNDKEKCAEGGKDPSDLQEGEAEFHASSLGLGELNAADMLDDHGLSNFYICYCADQDKECPMSTDGLDCRTVQRRRTSVARLVYSLVKFNRRKELKEFDSSLMECSVCFTEQLGDSFMRLEDCRHAFCRECWSSHLSVQIKESRVQSFKCLSQGCDSELYPHQVKDLVSKEQYARYDKLVLQAALEAMPDIVYCPRRQCQTPVIKDGTFGHCTRCYHAFCVTCTHAYHGSKPCPINSEEMRKVHERYRNGNQRTKEHLEKRYGKRNLKQALEDAGTLDWIKENTRPCPKCGSGVQKIHGCNMMQCTCGAFFCWLCGKLVLHEWPYQHFKIPGECYHKIFYGLGPEYFEEYGDYELGPLDWEQMEEDVQWEEWEDDPGFVYEEGVGEWYE